MFGLLRLAVFRISFYFVPFYPNILENQSLDCEEGKEILESYPVSGKTTGAGLEGSSFGSVVVSVVLVPRTESMNRASRWP